MTITINNTQERNEVLSWISDLTKDVYGTRIRQDYSGWSNQEIADYVNSLMKQAEEVADRELAWEKKCIEEFERSIKLCMDAGAENRQEALRWLVQAWEVDNPYHYGAEEFAWAHNLGYHSDLTKELEDVFTSMNLAE